MLPLMIPGDAYSAYKSSVIELKGGINENVSSLELLAGELTNCKNYMMAEGGYGGYISIPGFSSFDGLTQPWLFKNTVLTVTGVSAAIPSGTILEGATSLESSTSLTNSKILSGAYIDGDAVVVMEFLESSYLAGETINISGSPVGTISIVSQQVGGSDLYNTAINLARATVQEVPGEGDILGLFVFENLAYAFRKAVGSAVVKLYSEHSTGWIEIDTSADPIVYSAGMHNFKFTTYNFYGGADTFSIFWIDGVNKTRSYDGTTVTTISNTGLGVLDVPINIVAHNFHLFLAYAGGYLNYSKLGDPADWATPGEIGLGNEITNLVGGVQSSLIILMEEGIKVLTGAIEAEFVLETFSHKSGGYLNTAQRLLGTVFFVDDRGLTTLEATDAYGDYAANSISQKFKSTMQPRGKIITGTAVSRDLNQYRIFFADRTQIYVSFEAKELKGATFVEYNKSVDIIAAGEDSSGLDKNIFSSKDGTGLVYRMDAGTSFDGVAITTRMSTAFYHYGSPRQLKGFKRATFEISADTGQTFDIKADFDYNEIGGLRTIWYSSLIYNPVGGAIYGEGTWGTMRYGVASAVTNRVPLYLQGIGTNMSYKIISNEAYKSQHIIQNIITDYTVLNRRM